MTDSKKLKFAENPENQCLYTGRSGLQCKIERDAGSDYCIQHGKAMLANVVKPSIRYELSRDDYLKKFADRVTDFAVSPDLQILRTEQGILQATLERLLNTIKDDEQLVGYVGEIRSLIAEIRTLRDSNVKLEKEMELLMDREQANKVAANLLEVIVEQVKLIAERVEMDSNTLLGQLSALGIPEEKLSALHLPVVDINGTMEKIADTYREAVNVPD